MTSVDRSRRIWEICDAALDREVGDRTAYIVAACGEDSVLRRDVEDLLAQVDNSGELLIDEPVEALATRLFSENTSSEVSDPTFELRRFTAPAQPSGEPPPNEFPTWPIIWLAAPIVFRAFVFAIALLTEPWSADPGRLIPSWAQLIQAILFTSSAFVLLQYGRSDRRAWSLGLLILDATATLQAPFVRAIPSPSRLTFIALHTPSDAFQAALLWFFASTFPQSARGARLARLFFTGVAFSLCLGALIAACDLFAQASAGQAASGLLTFARALQRHPISGKEWYFTLQFLALIPLFVATPLKLRESSPNDQRRFAWLTLGIAVGFFPLAADTIFFTAIWPRFGGAAGPGPFVQLRAAVIIIALTATPVAATYAALVQRAFDVRLVVRAALQYVLAQSFVVTIAAVPFIAIVAIVAVNRDRSVSELLTGPRAIVLITLGAGGILASIGRRRLMSMVDTRFFREEVDAKRTLLAVAATVRHSKTLDDFRDVVVRALESAFHPISVVTVVAGDDDRLHALDADLPPLSNAGALAQLLGGSEAPFSVEQSAPIVARLGLADREWLDLSGAELLIPLRDSTDVLLGLIALGAKKSELPYTMEDQTLLSAVGAAGGLALVWLRKETRVAADVTNDPSDPPGRECVECGAVLEADSIACRCGGLLQRAAVPHIWKDRLQFVRRIGEGGAGVVYQVLDLRLRQHRAVKTLPGTDPVIMSRLQSEARKMAATKHQNLAVLHGLEIWRGAPMLVMEFLEGGTLSSRLRQGPMSTGDTLRLGIELARAVAALHGNGFLHRDIKPSNIGFTADGTPKLLDFGLAKLMAVAVPPSAGQASDSTRSVSAISEPGTIRGTPAYISPWVLSGSPPAPADDLWGLSITLLEVCTGTNPFSGPTVAATIARVLSDVHRVKNAIAPLPTHVRELFAGLLTTRLRGVESADDLVLRLQQCAQMEA